MATFQPTTGVALPLVTPTPVLYAGGSQPDYTQYPTESDLADYLVSLGILNPNALPRILTALKLGHKARSAADQWEKRVGWGPYLSSGQTKTRVFDPPGPNNKNFYRGGGRILELQSGLISLASLTIGNYPGQTGTLLTLDRDFVLTDAAGDYQPQRYGYPFEEVHFLWRQYGYVESIAVEGVWGFCETMDADDWDAILNFGASLAFAELALQISRGIISYKDLNTEFRYAVGKITPLDKQLDEWTKTFATLAHQRKRITM